MSNGFCPLPISAPCLHVPHIQYLGSNHVALTRSRCAIITTADHDPLRQQVHLFLYAVAPISTSATQNVARVLQAASRLAPALVPSPSTSSLSVSLGLIQPCATTFSFQSLGLTACPPSQTRSPFYLAAPPRFQHHITDQTHPDHLTETHSLGS